MSDRPFIPNTFPTPNVIVDKVMPYVKGPAFKVLMAITRWTLGWHEWRPGAAVQLSLGRLRGQTGLSRQGVIAALHELTELKIVQTNKAPRNSRVPNSYTLNLDITTGELVHNLDQSKTLTSPTSPQIRPELVHNLDSLKYKRNTSKRETESDKQIPNPQNSFPLKKKKSKPPADPAQLAAFAEFYRAYPRHEARADAEKAWRKLNPDPALRQTIMAATASYAAAKANTEKDFIKLPSSWLTGRRWEDETDEQAGGAGRSSDDQRKETFING